MTDTRAEPLVDLVLDYSIGLKEGDRLFLQYDPAYSEYSTIFGRKVRERGAEIRYDPLSFNPRYLLRLVERFDMDEWNEELERRNELSRWCNTRVLLDLGTDDNFAEGIKDKDRKVAKYEKLIVGPYKKVLYRTDEIGREVVRWNIVGFPSRELAQQNGMSFQEFQNFVYSATLGDGRTSSVKYWQEMGKQMKKVKQIFDSGKQVHIYVPGNTDLHLNLKGREGEICEGKSNMPDGEIFYAPIETSAEGFVYFQHPSMRNTGKIEGIELKFEKGQVVDFDAKENRSGLEATLAVDDGARKIGELGIGFNSGIQIPTMNLLFDEKIAGTIHIALGKAISKDLSNGAD